MPFGLQPIHIIVVAVVALLIFGPSKLPELGRSLGRGINEFKKGAKDIVPEFTNAMNDVTTPTTGAPANSQPAPMQASPMQASPLQAVPLQSDAMQAAPTIGSFCTSCGSKNPADARFCNKCGTALPVNS